MRTIPMISIVVAAVVLVTGRATGTSVGTAFTYQGMLEKNGVGLNGACSVRFSLYDAVTGGNLVGAPNPNTVAVTASKGLFTATLDFGALAFNGDNARWLEIEVKEPNDASYTALTPRQPLTPVPYAIYAVHAPGGGFALPYAGSVSAAGSDAFSLENTGGGGTAVHGIGQFTGGYFQGLAVGSIGVTAWGAHQGVWGTGTDDGLYGEAFTGFGVNGFYGQGIFVPNGTKAGVYGHTISSNAASAGTRGEATYGYGVEGVSSAGIGVVGQSTLNFGVYGTSEASAKAGIYGHTSSNSASGVLGKNESSGLDAQAVFGYASAGAVGVRGVSEGNDGIVAMSNAPYKSGIWGNSTVASGYGGAFSNTAGGVALLVSGLAQVGSLQIQGGSDLAEPFDVAAGSSGRAIEPGMVVVIDEHAPGDLRLADRPYDASVAGVISGANGLAPGVVLRAAGEALADGTHPVAMTGRVWCRVDASYGAVVPGDLLTTSSTPGHAMRATDRERRSGAVLGKAMTTLERGLGLVLVLVSLQ